MQFLAEQFWNRCWQELTHRQMWHATKPSLKIGDIVHVKDESASRCQWPLAKIVKAKVDEDGLVRCLQVQHGNPTLDKHGQCTRRSSVLERPIQN